MKKYTSFQELDNDIRKTYLQSQICKEELFLHVNETKEQLHPSNIITSIIGSISSSTLISKLGIPIAIYLVKKLITKK